MGDDCLAFTIFLDGEWITTEWLPNPGEGKRASNDVNGCRAVGKGLALLVSFGFSALETSGDVAGPMHPDVGTIDVRVYRASRDDPLGLEKSFSYPFVYKPRNGHSGRICLTHCVSWGTDIKDKPRTLTKLIYHDALRRRIGRYIFKYRSKEALQRLSIDTTEIADAQTPIHDQREYDKESSDFYFPSMP